MNLIIKKLKIWCGVITLVFLLPTKIFAQTLVSPPELSFKDDAGVDPVSGVGTFTVNDLNIGNGFNSLSHTIATYGNYYWNFIDDYTVNVSLAGSSTSSVIQTVYVSAQVGHARQDFRGQGDIIKYMSTYSPKNRNGATLVEFEKFKYIYTRSDGAEVYANQNPQKIIYPNGYTVLIYIGIGGRKESVVSNTGLQLKYFYKSNSLPASPTQQQLADVRNPIKIVALNNAFDYCSYSAPSCSFAYEWPTVSYAWPTYAQMFSASSTGSGPVFSVTDSAGRKTEFKHSFFYQDPVGKGLISPRITGVKSFSNNASAATSLTYDSVVHCYMDGLIGIGHRCVVVKPLVISSIKIDGNQWTYSYPTPDTPYVMVGVSKGPNGSMSVLMDTLGGGGAAPVVSRISTPDNIIANYYIDNRALIKDAIIRGKNFEYYYDNRGNLIKTIQKTDGINLISEAGYPATCSNLKTCNQPMWVKDNRGNIYDYEYYEEHGGVKSITKPPVNGIRAKVWFKYQQHYAWFKDQNGNLMRAATPIWLLTEERSCTSGNALADDCQIPSSLVVTKHEYGAQGVLNNLWRKGTVVIANGKSLRTCYQYDRVGNIVGETLPRAELASCN